MEVLSRSKGLEVLSFFEERSAGFFALGRVKRDLRPTAVVTTSGTAVAELLPGAMESRYNGLPLVLITADRPAGYGEKGTPQTLQDPLQVLKPYTALSLNISCKEDLLLKDWSANKGNLHLNTAFDEPLVEKPAEPMSFTPAPAPDIYPESEASLQISDSQWNGFFQSVKQPLLLVGELSEKSADTVKAFLENYPGAVFTEPLSRLSTLKNRFTSGETILSHGLKTKAIDGVIRLGGVPRVRFWRDLEQTSVPVLSLSSPPFWPGLKKPSLNGPLRKSLKRLARSLSLLKSFDDGLRQTDKILSEKQLEIFKSYPLSEPHWMWRLRQSLPDTAKVFLGNSLPVRLWDRVSLSGDSQHSVTGQAGVNGIEGLVSRFLGECEPDRENWAFLGDLSALYDMSGFWISREGKIPPYTLVVINNFGGRIFSRLYSNPAFLNQHQLSFAPLAKMWGLDYELYFHPRKFRFTPTRRPRLIEIRPDNQATEKCLQICQSLRSDL